MNHLLVIDPQNDFCDIPGASLPVPGADADMQRLAAFIDANADAIDAITVTLDSHTPIHVAHPTWWCDENGAAPNAFTAITAADMQAGRFRTRDPARQDSTLAYVRALEAGGKYVLVVWPEHCLVGGWGHGVHAAVKQSVDAWSRAKLRPVDFVFKGLSPGTEHYSAVRAEVPVAGDVATQVNQAFVDSIAAADRVIIAGEALSHCVAATVRDLDALIPGGARKWTLLTDASSSVAGFEKLGHAFVEDLTHRGMAIRATEDLSLAEFLSAAEDPA